MAESAKSQWHVVLVQLRKEARLSQRAAAQMAGVSRAVLRKLENGTSEMSISKVEAMLAIYGYELDAIKIN